MEAKCSKCNGDSFSIKKRTDKAYCYVICNNCGNIVGVLEDIDFNKKYNKIIDNHGFFERRINELEDRLKSVEKNNEELLSMIEHVTYKIDKAIK